MALDFAGLQTELFSRGFQYLNDGGAELTRAKRWINDAMHDIDDMEDWPYRLGTATASGGSVTISDLGAVLSVIDGSQPLMLDAIDQSTLTERFADLTATGSPTVFYVQDAAPQVQVFPASTTATLTVRYLKVSPDLSGSSDVPLMPDRFRYAIVEYAVAKAHRDKDNYDEAALAVQAGDAIVQRMRDFYAQRAPTDRQVIVAGAEDW